MDLKAIISTTLSAEIQRQGAQGIADLDLDALAEAIAGALEKGTAWPLPTDEGREPDELNSSNDA